MSTFYILWYGRLLLYLNFYFKKKKYYTRLLEIPLQWQEAAWLCGEQKGLFGNQV